MSAEALALARPAVVEHGGNDGTAWRAHTFELDGEFALEGGGTLPQTQIAYTTAGRLSPSRDNTVWVFHALTGNARVHEWWPGLAGPGRLLDPARDFIVCANVLGSCYGTTSPASSDPATGRAYGRQFPAITMRDIVAAHRMLLDHLGVDRIRLGIGGSMGGQQALEWACAAPGLFDQLVLVATNARHSPWGIACNEAQRMALEADGTLDDGTVRGGLAGLEAARAIAMLTYRGYEAFRRTQSDASSLRDGFAASGYLRHQGRKLADRFDPWCYWALTKAMDSHDVGRDRGSVDDALGRIRSSVLVAGIRSDILFPPAEQEAIARAIPRARMALIDSAYGHDGFLVEAAAIEACVREFLR